MVADGKIVVVGDSPTCSGFRLVGIEEVFVLDGNEAEEKIIELLSDESVSIIIVNEKVLASLDWRLKRRIDRTAKPVVISVPDKNGPLSSEDSLKSMIKKALGFELMK